MTSDKEGDRELGAEHLAGGWQSWKLYDVCGLLHMYGLLISWELFSCGGGEAYAC